MAAALTKDGFHVGLEVGQHFHRHKGLSRTGKAAAVDVGVTIAAAKHYLNGKGAVRVHGGGFAGTAQAFVPLEKLDAFKAEMEAILGAGKCHILSIRPEGGAVL